MPREKLTSVWSNAHDLIMVATICFLRRYARSRLARRPASRYYLLHDINAHKLAPKVELSKSHKTWTQQDLVILSKEKKKLSCLGQYMPESQIDPCWACFGSLRNRVLPVPLGVASHHKQRAMLQEERTLLRSSDLEPLSSSFSRSRSGWQMFRPNKYLVGNEQKSQKQKVPCDLLGFFLRRKSRSHPKLTDAISGVGP